MVMGASLKSASYIWLKTCGKRRAARIDLRSKIVSAYEHGKSSGSPARSNDAAPAAGSKQVDFAEFLRLAQQMKQVSTLVLGLKFRAKEALQTIMVFAAIYGAKKVARQMIIREPQNSPLGSP